MLFDTSTIPKKSLDDLTSIFQKITFKSNISSTEDSEGQHLLILQKSISSIINHLTSFSNLRKLTGIGKVIWIDPSNNLQYDYEYLLSIFKSFVIMIDSDSDLSYLNSTITLLKTKIIPFTSSLTTSSTISSTLTSNTKIKISIIFAGSSNTHSIQQILENQGVLGDVDTYIWSSFKPILLESDLITLSLSHAGLRNIFNGSEVESIDKLSSTLLQLIITSNYKIRITNAYLKGEMSVLMFKKLQKDFKSHLNSLGSIKKKLIQDQDETLFLDTYSFFNRNVDLVCLDRSVDLVSAVLNQVGYTGLCHDILGSESGFTGNSDDGQDMKLGFVSFKPDLSDDSNEIKFRLGDSKDEIYDLIKDLNFSHVGSILNNKAKEIQIEYDKRNKLKDIEEMKKFVGELNHLKDLQNWIRKHTLLAEFILNRVKQGDVDENTFRTGIEELDNLGAVGVDEPASSYFSELIELQQDILGDQLDNKGNCAAILEFMYSHEPKIHDIVRLLVLTSIVKKGIREQEYDQLKAEIVNKYGIKYIPLLIKLNQLKLVYPREQVSFLSSATNYPESSTQSKYQLINDFSSLSRSLDLLPEAQDHSQPLSQVGEYKDADFAYPGFVPVIARLTESIYSRNYNGANKDSLGSTTVSPSKPRSQNILQTSSNNSVLSSLSKSDMGIPIGNGSGRRLRKFGWDNLDLSSINGELQQEFLIPENKKNLFNSLTSLNHHNSNKLIHSTRSNARKDLIIVCCVGGLTYSEISTLRYILTKKNGNELFMKGKQLLIVTTGVINGDDVIEALM